MALISLIPVFPLVAVYPAFWFVVSGNNYAQLTPLQATWIIIIFCLLLLAGVMLAFAYYVSAHAATDKSAFKNVFSLFCITSYVLIDVLLFILGTGIPLYGGESMFFLFFSGPLASLSLILFGFITDRYQWYLAHSKHVLNQ